MHFAKLTGFQGSLLTLGAIFFAAGLSTADASTFLPTYTGPENPALALSSINATFNGSAFDFSSTSDAPINLSPQGSLYVWGINRGSGTARFFTSPPTPSSPDIGSNVLFDAVLIINPAGTSVVNLFNGQNPEIVPASDIHISGNTINASLPLSFLPTTGAQPQDYSVDLWPRVGAGQNDQIAQFYGNINSINPVNAQVSMVPEPTPWLLLTSGLGLIWWLQRRKQGRQIDYAQQVHWQPIAFLSAQCTASNPAESVNLTV